MTTLLLNRVGIESYLYMRLFWVSCGEVSTTEDTKITKKISKCKSFVDFAYLCEHADRRDLRGES
jgi:hypothetical protein